jgi:hypothetical protein
MMKCLITCFHRLGAPFDADHGSSSIIVRFLLLYPLVNLIVHRVGCISVELLDTCLFITASLHTSVMVCQCWGWGGMLLIYRKVMSAGPILIMAVNNLCVHFSPSKSGISFL